jgi:DNA-binding SARP family transcriptional activator/tetratricopeptide (TPR) repeat protein
MRVRLLGPVDVLVDDAPRSVPGLRRKAVLAILALRAGRSVSTDLLIGAVWPEGPPATATNTLQRHISGLREILGDRDAIVARAPGYLLDLGAEATDVQVAERLLREGSAATDAALAARSLHAAVALWRGKPLADLVELPWFADEARRLENLLGRARQALVEDRLALGEHAELLPDLLTLAERRPLQEVLQRQLMLALYRTGRQAEALEVYRRLYDRLGAELGITPSTPLRDLQSAILRQDSALDLPARTETVGWRPVPAQLPPTVTSFAGRERELALLDAAASSGDARSMVVSALSGTAGVGKTTLAVHWAHRAASRFPDGQLYVDLRGFDADCVAVDPSNALRGFLAALGVPATRIPEDVETRTALYRSLLAGRRVLVVLDNARDAAQVRPLLPGAPGCLAVVTSRRQLLALVVTDGAQPIALDVMSADEAYELLARRLTARRASDEAEAVREIVRSCANLPLALAIVAARAATRPGLPLARLADELRDAAGPLDALTGTDPGTDARAVFGWSYRNLGPEAARLFRLLGLHPGPDVSAPAAASVAGLPGNRTGRLLTELVEASLLIERRPGRYVLHSLLRAYADEQALAQDDDQLRGAAVQRMLGHYARSARVAALRLEPHQHLYTAPEPPAGVTAEDPADALEWFVAEHAVLLALVNRYADEPGEHLWQLGAGLTTYLNWQGHWPDLVTVHQVALASAQRAAAVEGQVYALLGLSVGAARHGRLTDMAAFSREALRLATEVGDDDCRARAHLNLAWADERQARYPEAIGHATEALELYRATGFRAGYARALNSLGWNHANLGERKRAVALCQEALPVHREIGDHSGEAMTWASIGDIHWDQGEPAQGAVCYRQALELYRRIGDVYQEAAILVVLGDYQQTAGDPAAARVLWEQAETIFDQLHHPDAEKVRVKLGVM